MMNTSKRYTVTAIQYTRTVDNNPDVTDMLGTYGNTPTSPAAIDRFPYGEANPREFRYFNPAMTGDETGNPDSPRQDYERAEALNRGDWCMYCVGARAVLEGPGLPRQIISSGGLWGIESDSEDSYFAEVAGEQFAELRDILAALGVDVPAAPDPADAKNWRNED